MADHVREHEETLDENNPRDYIDTILIEIKKTTGKYPIFHLFVRTFFLRLRELRMNLICL